MVDDVVCSGVVFILYCLFLDFFETSRLRLGVCKTPVATGSAGGNMKYNIDPGKPDDSILYHRMLSTDPEVKMPEIGRSLIDQAGVELIYKWIFMLEDTC